MGVLTLFQLDKRWIDPRGRLPLHVGRLDNGGAVPAGAENGQLVVAQTGRPPSGQRSDQH